MTRTERCLCTMSSNLILNLHVQFLSFLLLPANLGEYTTVGSVMNLAVHCGEVFVA